MTREEAIKKLKEWQRYFQSLDLDVDAEDDNDTNEADSLKAFTIAIKSIQAWDKVKEEINQKSNDVPIIYNDSDRYEVGLSIAYSDCLDIIDNHLQEVTNCE